MLRARVGVCGMCSVARPSLAPPNPTPDNLIQLAKLSGIKGAKSITCPDNRLACPGNNAVNIVVKLDNTLDQFKAVVPQWRANVATAASVRIDRVGGLNSDSVEWGRNSNPWVPAQRRGQRPERLGGCLGRCCKDSPAGRNSFGGLMAAGRGYVRMGLVRAILWFRTEACRACGARRPAGLEGACYQRPQERTASSSLERPRSQQSGGGGGGARVCARAAAPGRSQSAKLS